MSTSTYERVNIPSATSSTYTQTGNSPANGTTTHFEGDGWWWLDVIHDKPLGKKKYVNKVLRKMGR